MDNLLLPGQVECWNVIFDLNGLGIYSLPWEKLKQVTKFLQSNYRGRVFRVYALNAPFTINVAWNIAKAFLETSTREKIHICRSNSDKDM